MRTEKCKCDSGMDVYYNDDGTIISSSCAKCNGVLEKKEQAQQKYKDARITRREHNIKRKKLQTLSEETATNNDSPRTDEFLKYVLVNTSGVEYNDIDVLYDIAIKTKRTLGAIEWVWRFAFGESDKLNFKNGEERRVYTRIQELKNELGV